MAKGSTLTVRLTDDEITAVRAAGERFGSMNRWCRRALRIVARLERGAWQGGPPPKRFDAHLVIIELTHDAARRAQVGEQVERPLIVAQTDDGELTPTYGQSRFKYREVSRWREIELDSTSDEDTQS